MPIAGISPEARMGKRRLLRLAWALILLGGAGPIARAQGVYHNQRLFVVPAPGKVTIDGDLEDWDLSGEIYIFGNQTGNATATRAYWSNRSFAAGVTQDVPHEARLEPDQWGSATVE
jgi:hypothetical protein